MKYILFLFCCALTAARPTTTAPRTGKDTAIFFANEIYPNGWDRLRFPVADATNIAAELHDHYGFDAKIYQNKTREEILNILSEYQRKNYAPDDQLLVFFTGHGYYDQYCTGYYVPKDGRGNDPGGASYLEWNSIQSRLSAANCQHILLMADACFAGTADLEKTCPELFPKAKGPREPVKTETGSERDQFIRATLRDRSRLYFAAAGAVTTNDRSEFARIFLDALQNDYDRHGILDMPTLRKRLKIAQPQPQFSSFGGNQDADAFLFIRPEPTTDRDGDGVPDTTDKCPERYGTLANGCPPDFTPGGSNTADSDLDGTPNDRDACPEDYGTAKARGCPDADDDGVPDKSDKCRYKPGEARWEGCPDSDGDSIPDHLDTCPDQKGSTTDSGCPPADRDSDGIPDKSDRCPDAFGKPNYSGCPDSDSDGIPDPDDKCPREKGDVARDGCPMPDAMIFVKGGSFSMGSPDTETGRGDDETQHTVTVSDFYLGKYEVTMEEYFVFCDETKKNYPEWLESGSDYNMSTGKNKDYYPGHGSIRENKTHPVTGISWHDAVAYCEWLSQKTGKKYRLPTEAEWEYAARGGNTSRKALYAGSNNIEEVAWYRANADSKTHPAGGKKPNELGLYDMTGNVWEWCYDWYGSDYYKNSPASNPTGPASGSYRVLRGGSWSDNPQHCRVANRNYDSPGNRCGGTGFRLARTN